MDEFDVGFGLNGPVLENILEGVTVEEPRTSPFEKDRPAPPLGEYVAAEVEVTRRMIAEGRTPSRNAVTDAAGRLERTEAYARWRYQGYVDGEIASL